MKIGNLIIKRVSDFTPMTIQSVSDWILSGDHEKTMYLLVRRVYNGKRSIHKNRRTKAEIAADKRTMEQAKMMAGVAQGHGGSFGSSYHGAACGRNQLLPEDRSFANLK
jgi:hypothetical protein